MQLFVSIRCIRIHSHDISIISMPKLKTDKKFAKRFTVTRTGKVIRRAPSQAHFKARATGEKSMGKRRDQVMRPGLTKTIKRLISA